MVGTMDTSRDARTTTPNRSGACSHLVALAVLACAAWPATVQAQQWEFEPFLEVIATYTDNVFLAFDGDETDDFVGQVNPGISISKDEGRVTADVNYRLQTVSFASESDLDAVYHQLDAVTGLEIAPRRLFVDLDASVDQSVVNPSIAIPASNVVATQNLGDVFTGNVNPYFIQPIGNRALLRLDYTYGVGVYDGFGIETFSNVDDFTQDRASFYLGSGDQETGLEWSLTYDYQNVDYEIVPDYRFERAGVAVAIPIGSNFRLVALGGRESDLIVSTDLGGTDSDFWEAGFRINAGRDSLLELRAGERFFGTSFFGNLQFSGRRFSASVLYRENPTTSALDSLGAPIAPFSVEDSAPLFPDDPTLEDIVVQPIRAEVYVAKNLQARFEVALARTLFFMTYADEERDFAETNAFLEGIADDQESATLGADYNIGSQSTLGLAATWTRFGFGFTDAETEILFATLSVQRQLGQRADLRLSYRHAIQESTSASDFGEYTENAIDLGIIFRW